MEHATDSWREPPAAEARNCMRDLHVAVLAKVLSTASVHAARPQCLADVSAGRAERSQASKTFCCSAAPLELAGDHATLTVVPPSLSG